MSINRLDTREADFEQRLAALTSHEDEDTRALEATVRGILEDVRARGDAAVLDYTARFDRRRAASMAELELAPGDLQEALTGLAPELREALSEAAARIEAYHRHQVQESWSYTEDDGTVLGQRVTPLDRVGVYVPGGRAAYPSTVLMNVVPARVAGVEEIVMVVPAPDGILEPVVLAAAAVAGVTRVFTIGGAQAVAALAFGTESVPPVDKIVGPGNVYVATAKSLVFGHVGIDSIAGPSEILIVCDGCTDPEWIVMDLFSQAEHDEQAQAILLCPDADFIESVARGIARRLGEMERAAIIEQALARRGALIRVSDLDEAVTIVNRLAPEHLELSVEDPEALAQGVRHAGAIFLGRYTTEVLGDYCAGPNHVLPTAQTARFSSPLGVYDFQKRTSIVNSAPPGARRLGRIAAVLARAEGLTAHGRAAECRMDEAQE